MFVGFLEIINVANTERHPLLEQPKIGMSPLGIEPGPPRWEATEHSSKELFEQLFNSYSEHLHEPATL